MKSEGDRRVKTYNYGALRVNVDVIDAIEIYDGRRNAAPVIFPTPISFF